MGEELRSDHASLIRAGRDLVDAAALFRRHTDDLLAVVRGTGGTAWGGGVTGVLMDGLAELLHQTCGRLHGNVHLTGLALQEMGHAVAMTEHDVSAAIEAGDPPLQV